MQTTVVNPDRGMDITLDDAPMTRSYIVKSRWNQYTFQRNVKYWKERLFEECGCRGPISKRYVNSRFPKAVVNLTVSRPCTQSREDEASIFMDTIVPALVDLGWIYRGTPQWMRLHVYTKKCWGGRPTMRIRITYDKGT